MPHHLSGLRVDHVGSLLRPEPLKQAFLEVANGTLRHEALAEAQDEAIRTVVARQQAAGLPVLSDGEFRRLNWQVSFSEVTGWDVVSTSWNGFRSTPDSVLPGEKPLTKGADAVVGYRTPATARLELVESLPLREFRFADPLTTRPVKAMIMGPDRVTQMCDIPNSTPYGTSDEFLADVVRIHKRMVTELVDAGCEYVQLDEPSYTGYVDPATLDRIRAAGDDPAVLVERAVEADNAVIAGLDGRATFAVHVCRGNRASMWHREGTYDAIAERLLGGLAFDRLLLEYDSERAGGFEPLRFVPPGRTVVLGLITTKSGRVETVDEILRRVEEASAFVPVDQIAVSPQCGFASGVAGNLLTEDEQWRKIDVMLETAERIVG